MKRLTLPLVLGLLFVAGCASGGGPAYRYDDGARTATYRPPARDGAGADLQTAAQACDKRFGVAPAWSQTSDAYKACMQAQGWKYAYETRDGAYPDPRHPGLVCHDIVVLGVVGSSCSNR